MSTAFPNGLVERRGYDEAGRLVSLETEDAGQSILFSYAWSRDGLGNPTQAKEAGTLPPVLGASVVESYTYDRDDRLATLIRTDWGRGGGELISYEYDADGNLVSRTMGGQTTSFSYDAVGRLVAQTTGANRTEHVYDGQGHRVARRENGQEKRYVLDWGRSMSQVLCETDSTGTITAYYLHGPQLAARMDAVTGTPRYYHTNDIGTVVALTDSLGGVTDQYAYTPYGLPAGCEGTTANPYTYVGGLGVMRESDGLYYMRARFYDAETGRFLSKDPLHGVLYDPIRLSRYVYALNNPASEVDPRGLWVGWAQMLLDWMLGAGVTMLEGDQGPDVREVAAQMGLDAMSSLAELVPEGSYWWLPATAGSAAYGAVSWVSLIYSIGVAGAAAAIGDVVEETGGFFDVRFLEHWSGVEWTGEDGAETESASGYLARVFGEPLAQVPSAAVMSRWVKQAPRGVDPVFHQAMQVQSQRFPVVGLAYDVAVEAKQNDWSMQQVFEAAFRKTGVRCAWCP